jgi:hypothetical protein
MKVGSRQRDQQVRSASGASISASMGGAVPSISQVNVARRQTSGDGQLVSAAQGAPVGGAGL